MTPALLALTLCAPPAPAPALATEVWQVAPGTAAKPWTPPDAPPGRARALVLISGLYLHPLRPAKATVPELRDWQKPRSELVKALAKDFDVFAFGYAQTVPVDEVARGPGLRDCVANLRKAGYTDIVLVGHSAGGIVARQFATENPGAGVTKVIAVAAPFAGAEVATIKVGVTKMQAPFVRSLAPEARQEAAKADAHAPPKELEFACVVCKVKRLESDGLVPIKSQWPDDLQKLGVPAALSATSHISAMEDEETAKLIHKLAAEKLTRWSEAEVAEGRKVLFGEPKARPGLLRRDGNK